MLLCCAQSCLTLCHLMDCSLPGSSVHGTFQARYASGLPFPTPGYLPDPGMEPCFLRLLDCRWILYHWATQEAHTRCYYHWGKLGKSIHTVWIYNKFKIKKIYGKVLRELEYCENVKHYNKRKNVLMLKIKTGMIFWFSKSLLHLSS